MSQRVVAIIQARMGSQRLPGKSMADLAGKPLLWRVIERVKRSNQIERIILATSTKSEDDVLMGVAQQCNVATFRGSENDVLDRYYQAARAFEVDVIVRLPADNPVPEPAEIDRIIVYHLSGETEFSSNLAQVFGNGYPNGIGAEVFNFDVLEEVWGTSNDSQKREHPHLNFFDYESQKVADPGRYRVGTVQCPAEFRRPDLVLDVNKPQEYEFMAELYEYLYPRNPEFHITDVIEWYENVYRQGRTGSAARGIREVTP